MTLNKPAGQKDTAVVLITDYGFLLPSLSAAMQIYAQADVMKVADIFVLITNDEEDAISELKVSFDRDGLSLRMLDEGLFALPADTPFHETHVPRSTLARFALQHVIPPEYENIVYIDGDVQILGSLLPLVTHRVQRGYIAAASDFLWLCDGETGRFWPNHQNYLKSLGIENPFDYFNAGVLAFTHETWRTQAPKALNYFKEFPDRCQYHDQSALNAIFLGKREILSPAYNFVSFYANLGLADLVKPRIAHFTGANKPWHYSGPPWDGRFMKHYREFAGKYPVLARYSMKPETTAHTSSRVSTMNFRFRSNVTSIWRNKRRRSAFKVYLKSDIFSL